MAAAWLRLVAMTASDSPGRVEKCSKTRSTMRATSAAVVCTPSSLLARAPVASGTYWALSWPECAAVAMACGSREIAES